MSLLDVSPPFLDFEADEDPLVLGLVSDEKQKLPGGTFLDFGPSLPHRYDVDQLELMAQSPLRVFAYWELREATILKALGGIPAQDHQNFQLLLKWKERDPARERYLDPGTTGAWWFDTLPESHYQLELGLYWAEHGWFPLLCSRELVTPRLALGPASEGEPAHTQSLLEKLVEQTQIGLHHRDQTAPPPPTYAEEQLPELATKKVDRIPSSEQHPEGLIGRINQVGANRDRPTSGW